MDRMEQKTKTYLDNILWLCIAELNSHTHGTR